MVSEADFQLAVRDEQFRQQFLGMLDLEDAHRYVCRVSYVDEPCDFYMMCAPSNPYSIVYVSSSSFEMTSIRNLSDFLGTLIDHEGFHAKQIFESPDGGWPSAGPGDMLVANLIGAEKELAAYGNEAAAIAAQKRAFSGSYISHVRYMLEYYKASRDSIRRYLYCQKIDSGP